MTTKKLGGKGELQNFKRTIHLNCFSSIFNSLILLLRSKCMNFEQGVMHAIYVKIDYKVYFLPYLEKGA